MTPALHFATRNNFVVVDPTRAACLTHYAETTRSVGLDPARTLKRVGLPPYQTDPDIRISGT